MIHHEIRIQVTNLFLQAFEGGGIQDPKNPKNILPTHNCVFICTTNYCQNIVLRYREDITNFEQSNNLSKLDREIRLSLSKSFGHSRALIDRIQHIICFTPHSKGNYVDITKAKLRSWAYNSFVTKSWDVDNEHIEGQRLFWTDSLIEYLSSDESYNTTEQKVESVEELLNDKINLEEKKKIMNYLNQNDLEKDLLEFNINDMGLDLSFDTRFKITKWKNNLLDISGSARVNNPRIAELLKRLSETSSLILKEKGFIPQGFFLDYFENIITRPTTELIEKIISEKDRKK